ncbi:MAG: hypothetical protein JWP08_1899 [Bryobacterales bacterium]|nr:hypothetical protein [Bryobacterales bacterium]
MASVPSSLSTIAGLITVQMEDLSFRGDFHVDNVRGRVLFLTGLLSTTTPRNDASAAVGQWDVRNAYRYVSEAYGGYHFNVNYGLNIEAGIFVSYVGRLFSYDNFEKWAYQPSYVSSNTPWFFNGVRVQWFRRSVLRSNRGSSTGGSHTTSSTVIRVWEDSLSGHQSPGW